MTYQPTRFLDGSCNADANCTQKWGHPGPCITPPAPAVRQWTKTELVDGDTVEWCAEITADGSVRWFCDHTMTGGEWDHSPERIAQIITNLQHDGYQEV